MNGFLVGPRYTGGKARYKLNRWIQSRLPMRTSGLYCEPFAGMLGILLNRPKSKIEIVNDLNGDIVSFWRAVRDYPEELERMCVGSVHSRMIIKRRGKGYGMGIIWGIL